MSNNLKVFIDDSCNNTFMAGILKQTLHSITGHEYLLFPFSGSIGLDLK